MTTRTASFPDPIGIVGFGQFGRAFAQLAIEAGLRCWALDPVTQVPAGLVRDASEPVGQATALVLSVPVLQLGDALRQLRPELRSTQLVVDVSSVRAGPERAMREILGTEIPWVGTHPLFGPSSIAMGVRPLRAVVCPNDQHPEAAERAADLYRALGCEVLVEHSEQHDRRMAYSHALAFFLAKGLLEAGATMDSSAVPPSFQAVERMMDSVRSDAGHLYMAIQCLNPYAAEARRALLHALDRLHAELDRLDVSAMTASDEGQFTIPDLGTPPPAIRETRELIDEVDRALLRVVGQRLQLARRAGQIKRERGADVRDPMRERTLLDERRQWAADESLDPEGVTQLFEALMAMARRVQEADRDDID